MKVNSDAVWLWVFYSITILLIVIAVLYGQDGPSQVNTNLGVTFGLQIKLLPVRSISLEADHPEFEARSILMQGLLQDRAPLPTTVDLYTRRGASAILVDNQGPYGSCTAHAMSYAFQLYRLRLGQALIRPSRLFWYAKSRQALGFTLSTDEGSTNGATVTALRNSGWIQETQWPYIHANVFRAPLTPVQNAAFANRINSAKQLRYINNINVNARTICTELAAGNTVIAGVMVYSSFMSTTALRTGNVPTPNPSRERLLGGHAIAITGYNSRTNLFSFRNSWGGGVGRNGMFTIPYAYLCNPRLVGDLWSL